MSAVSVAGPVGVDELPREWLDVLRGGGWYVGPEHSGYHWFAVVVDGKVAGVGGVGPHGDDTAWMGPVEVRPEFRGRGFQRELIRVRVAEAARMGFGRLITAVSVRNPVSMKNVTDAGFQLERTDWEKHWVGMALTEQAACV